ncbi:MAG: hypothetical protein J6C37_05805 [Roseburia sp.]|nr:hypothetical protein [Roseburia sp.]
MENWNGFKKNEFTFEGRKAILVFPDDSNKTNQWLFKTEYWDAFPNLEIEMVKQGWHLAYIENKTRWCLDEDLDLKQRFADFLAKEYGLCKKCVPVGMSCGGMFAVKFAARHPEYISALYIDAPVLNLLSCPADLGVAKGGMWEEFVNATGMSLSELICCREHPIDKLPILIQNDIPVVMVYGKADTVVPYCENGAILEKYYKEHGGKLLAIGKDGCEHHPHGLENPQPIVDFIMKYA